jgi:hypothetical protein
MVHTCSLDVLSLIGEHTTNDITTFVEMRKQEKAKIQITSWVQDLDLSI